MARIATIAALAGYMLALAVQVIGPQPVTGHSVARGSSLVELARIDISVETPSAIEAANRAAPTPISPISMLDCPLQSCVSSLAAFQAVGTSAIASGKKYSSAKIRSAIGVVLKTKGPPPKRTV